MSFGEFEVNATPMGEALHATGRSGKNTVPDLGKLSVKTHEFLFARRQSVSLIVYCAIAAISYTLAFLMRFDLTWRSDLNRLFFLTLPVVLLLRLVFSKAFHLTAERWRFVSPYDVLRLAAAVTTDCLLFYLLSRTLGPQLLGEAVPRVAILLYWLLSIYLTAGVWLLYRTGYEQVRNYHAFQTGGTRRVLIVGAGEAGAALARQLYRAASGYRLVGFIDDNAKNLGTLLDGVPVRGGAEQIPLLVEQLGVDEVLIALPSATPKEIRRVYDFCEAANVSTKVLPGLAAVLRGEVHLQQLRDLRIEDLLGRDPVELALPELADDLCGQSVLITGAAGSIGSELARQIARYSPSTLVLLDQAESDLFYLSEELRPLHPTLNLRFVVGDIIDATALQRVFAAHHPSRVFHAAAYKHVPLLEDNAAEAIRNNVIGTWEVAQAAGHFGTKRFVLVSTDKAVRPVSVMGATKHLAERVILELQNDYLDTVFTAVRFGNVLGSSGSVIPLFQKQIVAGRALTVTDPEATRYFMTIPEAVQLILQASILPEMRGHIAMLEMGEPVNINELAKNLLRLAGRAVREGENIIYTGLRPGERLHEELIAPDEATVQTLTPKVRLILGSQRSEWVLRSMKRWRQSLDSGLEGEVLLELLKLYPDLQAAAERPKQASSF